MLLLIPVILSMAAWLAGASEKMPICLYTYNNRTGNKYAGGKGSFPNVQTIDILHPDLAGKKIEWVLGYQEVNKNLFWVAADSNNTVWTFALMQDNVPSLVKVSHLPTIPMLSAFKIFPPGDSSHLSHPVCLDDQRVLYVSKHGSLVLLDQNGKEVARREVNAIPDARPVLNRKGDLVALYTDSFSPYNHQVFGDEYEGSVLRVFRTSDLSEHAKVAIPRNSAFQGVSPFWADVDGDGQDDIVTTITDHKVGASVYAFMDNGFRLAQTQPIGEPYRWRHELSVANFGPNGEPELMAVHTPHEGVTAEFFRAVNGSFVKVAGLRGYTSHQRESRNFDRAVAGDFNGDGIPEMVIPSSSDRRLVGIQRTDIGTAKEIWSFWLGSRASSNLAAVRLQDGGLGLGVGLHSGMIKVFLPTDYFEGRDLNNDVAV